MSDRSLADHTIHKLHNHYGENIDVSRIPETHRTVVLVYHCDGIIGNGGFQYLFEGDFLGDPEFLYTRQAFKTIKASKASEAFTKAFAVFPNSTPPKDIERRLKIYQSKYTLVDALKDRQSPDAIYLDSMKQTMQLLESYIQSNQAIFDSLK